MPGGSDDPGSGILDPTISVFLSLYLLLLTFFILLSSHSKTEQERMTLVRSSLDSTFGPIPPGPQGGEAGPRPLSLEHSLANTLAEAGLREEISFLNRGSEIVAEFPQAALYTGFDIGANGLKLMAALVAARNADTQPMEVGVSLGYEPGASHASSEVAVRAHALAAHLTRFDPAAQVGIERRATSSVRWVFRPRTPN